MEATFPLALEYAFEKILKGKRQEQKFIQSLFIKLDEWLKCSCESVYHYTVRYYLEEYYKKNYENKYLIKDEQTIGGLLKNLPINNGLSNEGKDIKRRRIDIAILEKNGGKVKEMVEMKMGKWEHHHISNSDFKKRFKRDVEKLVCMKEIKPEIRCYLLKITHVIPYSKKDKIENLTNTYRETIVNRFNRCFEGYEMKLVNKVKAYTISVPEEEVKALVYHLWEIVECTPI